MSMMNVQATAPTDVLELQAADQRRRIHDSVLELRGKLEDKLDVRRKAAEYVWPASGVAAVIGLVMGWGAAGIFSPR